MKEFREKEYFQEGKIYNREYFGGNESYKVQNGKETFRILKIHANEKIEVEYLFCQRPNFVDNPELKQNKTYWDLNYMVGSQKENIYNLVEDPKDYFIHSCYMSMTKGVEKGLLDVQAIYRIFRDQSSNYIRQSPITWFSEGKCGLQMPAIQGVSDNSLLQTIVMIWNNRQEMEEDVRNVFPGAWFM